jgi:hypothetical protein
MIQAWKPQGSIELREFRILEYFERLLDLICWFLSLGLPADFVRGYIT